MQDGYGFLRSVKIFIIYHLLMMFMYHNLKLNFFGLKLEILLKNSKTSQIWRKVFPLVEVEKINGREPEYIRDRVPFESLTPLFPSEKFKLTGHSKESISTRVMDLFSPIGKGQRGMIVAQPKTGKTVLFKRRSKCNCS